MNTTKLLELEGSLYRNLWSHEGLAGAVRLPYRDNVSLIGQLNGEVSMRIVFHEVNDLIT
jgi:hypothetical protein